MTALRKSVPLILTVALLGHTAILRADTRQPGVEVLVRGEASPLSAVHVWAYQVTDLSLHTALTDARGNFLFPNLPAGFYKIIARKAGFLTAVIPLARETAKDSQRLEVNLRQRQAGQTEKDDFWGLVSKVPADVLHQIEIAEAGGDAVRLTGLSPNPFGSGRQQLTLPSNFKTEMQALTGVDQTAATSSSQMSGGNVGIQGQLGDTQVDLKGRFFQLSSGATYQPAGGGGFGTGQAGSLTLDLSRGAGSQVSIRSFNNRLITRGDSGDISPVDVENYQVSWSRNVGENGHSEVAARYTSENNFHRQALASLVPLDIIPGASRSWNLEAAYTENFSDSNSLQAGMRYRQRQFGLADPDHTANGKANPGWQDLSNIDLFIRGGVRVQPAMLMEYGLYSTLADGRVALTPQGGVVLQLGSNWQLETSAAHRIYRNEPTVPDFLPTLFAQRDLCEQGSSSCYQTSLTRKVGTDDSLTFGAAQRTIGDTLRLYFSDDFFDRESLYLVRGDKLPELRVGFQHKISPKIVTKLDSSVASGGGGLFIATDGLPYKNQVRYMVTSLDTQFLGSSTGVFVAFHHLEQQLDPAGEANRPAVAQMDFQRLQLMVNQNLNFLLNLASEWAVQLNMELSRGLDPTTGIASDTIRRRILGGIAVKF
jgi:hypothetical protein